MGCHKKVFLYSVCNTGGERFQNKTKPHFKIMPDPGNATSLFEVARPLYEILCTSMHVLTVLAIKAFFTQKYDQFNFVRHFFLAFIIGIICFVHDRSFLWRIAQNPGLLKDGDHYGT